MQKQNKNKTLKRKNYTTKQTHKNEPQENIKRSELNAKTKKKYELKKKTIKQHESEIPFLRDMSGSLRITHSTGRANWRAH